MTKENKMPWNKMTTEQLVDTFSVISREINALNNQYEKMRRELLFRRNSGIPLHGRSYYLEAVEGQQTRIDTDLLKTEYGPAWYDKHCKTVDTVSLLVREKPATVKAALRKRR